MDHDDVKKRYKGIVPVQLYPFTKSGELNLDGIRQNTQFLVDFVKSGQKEVVLLTNGSTSEFYAMSVEEQKDAIKTVMDTVKGEMLVVAGVSQAGTRETVKMARYAESAGADAVMVVLPYYHQATKEGMYLHYKTIAESIGIGIMVYNNPFASGSWVDPQLMKRISKLKNVIALKENTAAAIQYFEMCRQTDHGDLIMIEGLGERMYPAACTNRCNGFVSDIANYLPSGPYELYEAGQRKDIVGMQKALAKLSPIFDIEAMCLADRQETTIMPDLRRGNPVYQAIAKFALDYVGLCGGEMRLPMVGLTSDEEKALANALDKMGVKKAKG